LSEELIEGAGDKIAERVSAKPVGLQEGHGAA
jgi:hypothetical protein